MTQGTPLELPDINGVLVRLLRADPGVAALVEQRVFARKFPERMDFPAVRIRMTTTEPASYPAPAWYSFLGGVDCYADSHQDALGLVREVQRALFEMEGTDDSEIAVSKVDAFDVDSGVDEAMSVPKPLWSVSVDITARTR